MRTAVLVDGAFFLKRFRRVFPDGSLRSPAVIAHTVHVLAQEHLRRLGRDQRALYRIFFYDAPPLLKRMHRPISNRSVDLATSDEAKFRIATHQALRRQRKVALRLGQLSDHVGWALKDSVLKSLLRRERSWSELSDDDFQLTVQQKAVDMRIGLDIASLAYRRLVDQMVLVTSDADFLPAAKLARREGIDFMLDPMGRAIGDHLHEHIDGVQSTRLVNLAVLIQEFVESQTARSNDHMNEDDN